MGAQQATGSLVVTLVFRQEGELWTGECVELGTATFGRSFEQTRSELVELIELHLNTLEDVGERERFLEEHSIELLRDVAPAEATRLSLEEKLLLPNR